MKRFFYTTFLFFAVAYLTAGQLQAQRLIAIGAKGGIGATLTNLELAKVDKSNPLTYEKGLKSASDFFASGYIEASPIPSLAFQGGLGFRTRSVKSFFYFDSLRAFQSQGTGPDAFNTLVNTKNAFEGIQTFLTMEVLAKYYFNKSLIKPFVGLGLRADQRLSTVTKVVYDNAVKGNTTIQSSDFEKQFKEDMKNGFNPNNFTLVIVGGVGIWKLNVGAELNVDVSKSDVSSLNAARQAGQSLQSRVWYVGAWVGLNFLQL